MVQVGGDQGLVGGGQNALHRAVGGGLDGGVDLFDGHFAAGDDLQVDDRDVRGRDADRGAVQLALQGRQDQAEGLGGAGRGRDHRQGGGAAAVQILVHRIQRRLVAGVGVDGGHIAALDAEQVVQDLGHGGQGIGGARAVGDDDVVGSQGLMVDLVDDGLVGTVAGGRDQHPLGAGGQVGRGLFLGREDAGAFEGDVDVQFLVRKLGRVTLGGDPDLAHAHIDPAVAVFDRAGEAAVDGVILQQMGVGLDRAQIVDRHHLDVATAMLDDRAQDEAADTAETIDGDADGHGAVSGRSGVRVGASMKPTGAGINPGPVTRRDRL